MSFFSRKRQPSQTTNTTVLPSNVTVANNPSAALSQTRGDSGGSPQQLLQLQQIQQQQQQQQQSFPGPAAAPAAPKEPRDRNESPNQDTSRPNGPPAPLSGPSTANSVQPQRPVYPWSARRIALPPPLLLARPGTPSQAGPSPSPFPRYGHSLPLVASQTGELFLFGGLVRETVKNDLYTFNTRDLAATLVQTTGEIPPPRVGHASALVSSVLIVWGGDTKTHDTDKQDDGLYLLNLGSREWTRVATKGAAPAGRYGHSVAMCASRFYVFGGQVDGEFLNDLWCFDLNTLKSTPLWELVKPVNEPPPRRTGHVTIALNDTLYIFGGTDGSYHYNDTWAFDVNSRTWQELTCIGYIPVPREGHAAALVDDVIYVFGGRGVDGKDLGDLAAFKITNQRWFMFQNMGPAPNGRSGHSMASAGSRVFVLGGESFSATRQDDPALVHVLDTKHIRYPDTNRPPGSSGAQTQKQKGLPGQRALSPVAMGSGDERAMSPTNGSRMRPINGAQMQPFAAPAGPPGPGPPGSGLPNAATRTGPVRPPRDPNTTRDLADVRGGGAQSDVEGTSTDGGGVRERVMSPSQQQQQEAIRSKSPVPAAASPANYQPPAAAQRAMSPTLNGLPPQVQRAASSTGRNSPVPQDAFYYNANSKVPNGVPNGRSSPAGLGSAHGHGHGRGGSMSNISAELLRQKEAELEGLRKREVSMKAALSKAILAGFTVVDLESEEDLMGEVGGGDLDAKKLSGIILKFRQERATMQAVMVEQARAASERVTDAERAKTSAIEETAFCRAKLAAYESGNRNELARLDNAKTGQLEQQLSRIAGDRSALERKIADLTESFATQSRLREQAEEKAIEATQRAADIEGQLDRMSQEHADLLERHDETSAAYRTAAEKLTAVTSVQELKDTEERTTSSQVDELKVSRDQHLKALSQAQTAIAAASGRAVELEEQWKKANEQVSRLQADVAELNHDLETRVAEANAANERVRDVENAWAKSREEADTLRALTTGSLGQLLDYHRDLQADEERVGRAQAEKAKVSELEAASLRNLLREANQKIDEMQAELSHQRGRGRALETDYSSLRNQVASLRAQVSTINAEGAQLRKDLSDREAEIRQHLKTVSEKELHLKTFRNYLADTGIMVDEEEVAASSSSAPVRLYEIETQLAERTRQQESLSRELQNARQQQQAAESQVEALKDELVRTKEQADGSSESDERVVELERKLAEAEVTSKERLQIMEQDYRTAVMCVKSTEKMLRRLKDELQKAKVENQTLKEQLDNRSGSADGQRRINGRGTPLSEDSHESALRGQVVDAQRQIQRLTSENQDLHRRLDLSQMDVDRVRREMDSLQREAEDRLLRIDDLEDDIKDLQGALQVARGGGDASTAEQLQRENMALKHENEQLSHKIELLLEVDHPPSSNYGDGSSSLNRPTSNLSSDMENQFDDWNRRLARPLSNDYGR